MRTAVLTVAFLSLGLALSGCQYFTPAPGPADGTPPWFARAGMGTIVPEIGDGPRPAGVVAAGRRLGAAPWYVEGQFVNPRWERTYYDEDKGKMVECEGYLLLYLLTVGREYVPFGDPDWRVRGYVGGGYHDAQGLEQDDDGLATTAGFSIRSRMAENWWVNLGVAHIGTFSELDRSDSKYRHNLLVDLSLVLDF